MTGQNYSEKPNQIVKATNRNIAVFSTDVADRNIDEKVVQSFGEEWQKFHAFSDTEIERLSRMYFDILDERMINPQIYAMDVGCGTGRWSKYLLDKIGFMEAIDPSDAIFTADKLLGDAQNVRLSKASTDNIPFPDETFDFGMSIGVLHHIPNTQKAMTDCVKKVKKGGYFYTYLYYDFEDRGFLFKLTFGIVDVIRRVVSSLPSGLKKFVCDLLAVFIYMPMILLGRFILFLGLPKIAKKVPLDIYQDQTFFVIRNDALDRFGTALEQRFSKKQIREMMEKSGLSDVVISEALPYWHAVGKRVF